MIWRVGGGGGGSIWVVISRGALGQFVVVVAVGWRNFILPQCLEFPVRGF